MPREVRVHVEIPADTVLFAFPFTATVGDGADPAVVTGDLMVLTTKSMVQEFRAEANGDGEIRLTLEVPMKLEDRLLEALIKETAVGPHLAMELGMV